MFFMIYDLATQAVVETTEGPREEIRGRFDALCDRQPLNDYIFCRGETREALFDKLAEAIEARKERKARLATLPPVVGHDISKDEWNLAMLRLSEGNRYRAANLAAHSYAAIPHDRGLILVGHDRDDATLLSGNNREPVPMPAICKSCKHSQKYASGRNYLVCDIGGPGLTRRVYYGTSCHGWVLKDR